MYLVSEKKVYLGDLNKKTNIMQTTILMMCVIYLGIIGIAGFAIYWIISTLLNRYLSVKREYNAVLREKNAALHAIAEALRDKKI